MKWIIVLLLPLIMPACEKLLPAPNEDEFIMAIRKGDEKTIDRYLNNQGNPNAGKDQPALVWAVAAGNPHLISKLLEQGADPNAGGIGDRTPLHLACRHGDLSTAMILARAGADVNKIDKRMMTPLMLAAAGDHGPIISWLIDNDAKVDKADRDGYTALMHALAAAHSDAVERLVLGGANLNAGYGQNALSLARSLGYQALLQSDRIMERYPDMGRRLAHFSSKTNQPAKGATAPEYRDNKPDYNLETMAQLLHTEINKIRKRKGLKTLGRSSELDSAATAHSRDMARRDFFGVTNPDGQGPLERANKIQALPTADAESTYDIVENLYRIRLYSGTVEKNQSRKRIIERAWLKPEDLVARTLEDWQNAPESAVRLFDVHAQQHGLGLAIDDRHYLYVASDMTRRIEIKETRVTNMQDKPRFDRERMTRLITERINRVRSEEGLVDFMIDPALEEAAFSHSRDMAEGDYLDHIDRNGEGPTDRAERLGISVFQAGKEYEMKHGIGENIFRRKVYHRSTIKISEGIKEIERHWLGEDKLAATIVNDFLANPSNKKNILSQLYRKQGIGVAFDQMDRVYITHKFSMIRVPELSGFQLANENQRPDFQAASFVAAIHRLVNEERAKKGIRSLEWDNELSLIATAHSQDMAGNEYFSHRDKKGNFAIDRAKRMGYRISGSIGQLTRTGIGENIFRDHLFSRLKFQEKDGVTQLYCEWRDPEKLAEDVVRGWMNSPGHKANILNEIYRREGIGIAIDEQESIYVTQNFF